MMFTRVLVAFLFECIQPILICIFGFLFLGGLVLLPEHIPDSILEIGMAAYVILVVILLLAFVRLLERIEAAFKNRVAGKNAEEVRQ
jgi:hypothetical protein